MLGDSILEVRPPDDGKGKPLFFMLQSLVGALPGVIVLVSPALPGAARPHGGRLAPTGAWRLGPRRVQRRLGQLHRMACRPWLLLRSPGRTARQHGDLRTGVRAHAVLRGPPPSRASPLWTAR